MPSSREITDGYRRRLIQLRAVTLRDLVRLWPIVDWANIDDTFGRFSVAAEAVIARDRNVANALATLYVRAHRDAAGIPGRPAPVPARPAPREQVQTALQVTGRAGLKKAAARGDTEEAAMATGLVVVAGVGARMVLNAARDSVRYSTLADDAAVGWRRVTGVNPCGFCRMVAGRGAVYSAETADFASHDHCSCFAEPAYADLSGPAIEVRPYEPSSRPMSEATRARTREWIAANQPAA